MLFCMADRGDTVAYPADDECGAACSAGHMARARYAWVPVDTCMHAYAAARVHVFVSKLKTRLPECMCTFEFGVLDAEHPLRGS